MEFLGIEPRISCMLSLFSTTEPYPQACQYGSKWTIHWAPSLRVSWARAAAAAAAKSLQSCPTLCDPIDVSPPGYPIPGILQARTPEWVAISFSSAWKWKVKLKLLSHVQLLADCSLPGSSIHGIFQARALEWSVIAFSRARASDTEMNTDWKLLEDGNFVLFTAYLHGLKQLLVYSKLWTNIESRVAMVFGTHCLTLVFVYS